MLLSVLFVVLVLLNFMSVLSLIPMKCIVYLKCFCKPQNQLESVGTLSPERQNVCV